MGQRNMPTQRQSETAMSRRTRFVGAARVGKLVVDLQAPRRTDWTHRRPLIEGNPKGFSAMLLGIVEQIG